MFRITTFNQHIQQIELKCVLFAKQVMTIMMIVVTLQFILPETHALNYYVQSRSAIKVKSFIFMKHGYIACPVKRTQRRQLFLKAYLFQNNVCFKNKCIMIFLVLKFDKKYRNSIKFTHIEISERLNCVLMVAGASS